MVHRVVVELGSGAPYLQDLYRGPNHADRESEHLECKGTRVALLPPHLHGTGDN